MIGTELNALNPPIDLFNPRGEELAKARLIQIFGGLLIACLDPNDEITQQLRSISRDAKNLIGLWRSAAEEHLARNGSKDLRVFVKGWATRKNQMGKWPQEVPAIDLVYGLRRWFPEFQQDPEQQVYFEAFTRQLQAAEELGAFLGELLRIQKILI